MTSDYFRPCFLLGLLWRAQLNENCSWNVNCENIKSLLLLTLKRTFNFSAHLRIFRRSQSKITAAWAGSSQDTNNKGLSANNKHPLSSSFIISWMCRIRSIGPSLEPWGTPAWVSTMSLSQPLTVELRTSFCWLIRPKNLFASLQSIFVSFDGGGGRLHEYQHHRKFIIVNLSLRYFLLKVTQPLKRSLTTWRLPCHEQNVWFKEYG